MNDVFEGDLARIRAAQRAPPPQARPVDEALAYWTLHGETEPEPPPMAVAKLLPYRGLGLIAGARSAGKTTVGEDLIVSMAAGLSFAGLPVLRTGGTAWFATEGLSEFMPRIDALARERLAPLGDNLAVNPKKLPIALASDVPPLAQADSLDVYLRRLAALQRKFRTEYGCELATICFDTMVSAARLAQAGDTSQNEEVISRLRRIQTETDALVILFDHLGKDQERGTRDSTVKEAAADAVLYVKGEKQADGTISDRRLILDKLRCGPSGLVLPFDVVGAPISDDSTQTIGIPHWNVAPLAAADGGRPPQRPRCKIPSPGQKIALLALSRAISISRYPGRDFGDEDTARTTTEEVWRNMFYDLSTAPSQDAKKKAWRRDSAAVIAAEWVFKEGGKVWLLPVGEAFVS